MEYINNNKKLKEICSYIRNNCDIIGIDTEFIRKFTYYPILCLIQVVFYNYEDKLYEKIIIDPLIKSINLKPFFTILKSKKIKKVIHSSSQDIDAFYFLSKQNLNNLDDTQIMAEFCGYESNIGYAASIKTILGIDFKKDRSTQNSNWGNRPLTDSQINYAYGDVEYLIPLYKNLLEKLNIYKNYDYYRSEMKYIIIHKKKENLIKNSWKKLKFHLNKEDLDYAMLIIELCKWRECKAIETNLIRNLIMSDELLEEIARKKPNTNKELKNDLSNLKEFINLKKVYKKEIIEIVIKFKNYYNKKSSKEVFYTNEKSFIYRNKLKCIYSKIEEIANEKKITLSRTISKLDIIIFIMKYDFRHNILYGWKKDVFGDAMKFLYSV